MVLAGTSLYLSQRDYWKGPKEYDPAPGNWIYGGTITLSLMWCKFTWRSSHELPVKLFGLFDLPYTIAFDTILLPLTIAQQVCGRPEYETDEKNQEDNCKNVNDSDNI